MGVGITAGLKPSGKPDMAMWRSSKPAVAAGCFTKNAFAAAPVILDREILKKNADNISTLVINAGQANACTGEEGLKNAQTMVDHIKKNTPGEALIMSTGVIGRQLDLPKIQKGIESLVPKLDKTEEGWRTASRAIMTTDTIPKLSHISTTIGSKNVIIGGTSKGAGMIHPNMATMLGVICTDVAISAECLQAALTYTVNRTYNCIDVDGDTSTNDTVVALANGLAGNDTITSTESEEYKDFRDALTAVGRCLSKQLVRDGEGATKLVTIRVTGAPKEEDAFKVAQSIAQSSLVKCAMYGKDPNWGRIVCAVGYSGVSIKPEKVSLFFSPGDETTFDDNTKTRVQIVKGGQPVSSSSVLKECASVLKEEDIVVEVDLGIGSEESTVWTCDLSKDYVAINADYTT